MHEIWKHYQSPLLFQFTFKRKWWHCGVHVQLQFRWSLQLLIIRISILIKSCLNASKYHYQPCVLRFNYLNLTLIRLGGAMMAPPLDISRDYSATRKALAATLYDNFLSSFQHILTPNLWRPGVRFRSYVTLCTCTSDRKWLQNVILCTKSMQIEFSHLVHINMHMFTLNCWN